MLTTRARLALVLPPYLAMTYLLYFQGLDGGDLQGLIAFLLAAAGLFVVVQATWLRGRLGTTAVLLWNTVVVASLGLVYGMVARGEEVAGLAAGLVVGVVTAFAVLWLGSLVQLRRRPRLFLSYRRSDSAAETARIFAALSSRYGARNVFMDVHTIRPGHDFRTEITRILRRCDAVLVIIGSNWTSVTDDVGRRRLTQADDPVRIEVETALDADVVVVPVLVGGATLPRTDDLPESLRALSFRHAAAVREDDISGLISRFEASFRPYTTDSVLPPPPRARLRRRLAVAALIVALVAPFVAGVGREVVGDAGRLAAVAVAPDGIQVAAIIRGGLWAGSSIGVWNSVTGEMQALRADTEENPVGVLVWSPDSRHVAVGADDGTITVLAADTLAEERTLLGFQGNARVSPISWSPSGSMIAASDGTGTLRVWRADTGVLLSSTPVASSYSDSVRWSPRSDAVAATFIYDDEVVVVDVLAAGSMPVHVLEHSSAATSVDWSPDGSALAAGFYDDPLLVVYRRSGATFSPQVLPQQAATVDHLAWSPDGTKLATTGGDVTRVFDAESGTLVQQYLVEDAFDPNVVWAPDGDALASADDTHILAWPVDPGAAPTERWHSPQDLWGSTLLAWTSDGRLITLGGADDVVRVWLPGHSEPVRVWAVSPWKVLVG